MPIVRLTSGTLANLRQPVFRLSFYHRRARLSHLAAAAADDERDRHEHDGGEEKRVEHPRQEVHGVGVCAIGARLECEARTRGPNYAEEEAVQHQQEHNHTGVSRARRRGALGTLTPQRGDMILPDESQDAGATRRGAAAATTPPRG